MRRTWCAIAIENTGSCVVACGVGVRAASGRHARLAQGEDRVVQEAVGQEVSGILEREQQRDAARALRVLQVLRGALSVRQQVLDHELGLQVLHTLRRPGVHRQVHGRR